jgi:hypothetical protein
MRKNTNKHENSLIHMSSYVFIQDYTSISSHYGDGFYNLLNYFLYKKKNYQSKAGEADSESES